MCDAIIEYEELSGKRVPWRDLLPEGREVVLPLPPDAELPSLPPVPAPPLLPPTGVALPQPTWAPVGPRTPCSLVHGGRTAIHHGSWQSRGPDAWFRGHSISSSLELQDGVHEITLEVQCVHPGSSPPAIGAKGTREHHNPTPLV